MQADERAAANELHRGISCGRVPPKIACETCGRRGLGRAADMGHTRSHEAYIGGVSTTDRRHPSGPQVAKVDGNRVASCPTDHTRHACWPLCSMQKRSQYSRLQPITSKHADLNSSFPLRLSIKLNKRLEYPFFTALGTPIHVTVTAWPAKLQRDPISPCATSRNLLPAATPHTD